MHLSFCHIDDIKTCNNDNMLMKSAYLCFNDFPSFFSVFINIPVYSNYANKITCIFDNEMKCLCLGFNLVQF